MSDLLSWPSNHELPRQQGLAQQCLVDKIEVINHYMKLLKDQQDLSNASSK